MMESRRDVEIQNNESFIKHDIRFCSGARDTYFHNSHGAQPCVQHFPECSGKRGQKLSLDWGIHVLSSFKPGLKF